MLQHTGVKLGLSHYRKNNEGDRVWDVTRKNLDSDGRMDTISNLPSASHNTNVNKQKRGDQRTASTHGANNSTADSQHPWQGYNFTRKSFKEKGIRKDNLIKL
jgi:hypothetical protein